MTRSMLRSLRPLALGLLALLALCVPAASAQSTRTQILRDCEDNGRLDGTYNPSEIRDARNNIPDDVDEYSNCRDVLSRATLSNAGGSTGAAGGAGGGSGGGGAGGTGSAGGTGGGSSAGGGASGGGTGAGTGAAQRPRLRPPPPHPRSCASSRPPCSTPASHAWWTAAGSP